MTSKLVVNTIEADTGISSVSFASSISMNSTAKFHFSDAGIDIGADTNINRPAAGVLGFNINSSEKVRIKSDGKVGIGTINPSVLLDVQGHAGSGAQTTIRSKSTAANASNFVRSESSDGLYIGLLKYGTGHSAYGALPAGGGAVYANSSVPITIMSDGGSGYINFATGGNTERLRIASDGHIFFANEAGTIDTTARLGEGHRLQLSGLSSNDGISVVRYNTSYGAWGFNLGRSRSGTLGTNTILANNDDIGHITFWGADGSDFNQAAQISAQVDGSPSDGTDMPGRLVFKTSADGSGTPSERLRITSTGFVGINENSPSRHLHVNSGSSDIIAVFESSDTSAQIQIKDSTGTCTIECLNDFRFQNGSAEILRLKSDKDVQVMDGNLILASGHGIDFSATPNGYAGSINETFDDYEEGYFTPTVGGWSASGTGVYGSGGQRGRYTKVGNLVTIFFHVYWTALNNASGVFAIENLPFAHTSSTTNLSTAVQMRYVDYSGDTVFAVGGNGYSSSLLFYAQNDNGNHNYVPVDSNGGRIEGCVTYITDS